MTNSLLRWFIALLLYQFNHLFYKSNIIHRFNWIYHIFFSTFFIELGPNGQHPFRALAVGHRPFMDSSSFSTHLRDLETYRIKAPAITSIPTSNTNTVSTRQTTNGLLNSDCQGYKPNAPQISGKISKWEEKKSFQFFVKFCFENFSRKFLLKLVKND